MKNKIFRIVLFAVGILASDANGEVFLGSNSSVNSLVIASNEVILISSLDIGNDNPAFLGRINDRGNIQTNGFDGDSSVWGQKMALAGPATLTFPDESTGTNSLPVCITFNRVVGTIIKSVLVPNGQSAQIKIPAGQTCRLFRPICANAGGYTHVYARVTDGTNTVNNIQLEGGEDFSGPLTLSLINSSTDYGSSPSAIVSYYITDDFTSLPSGALQGGNGSFLMKVERSSDLTNWTPVVIQPMANVQKEFYRLEISK